MLPRDLFVMLTGVVEPPPNVCLEATTHGQLQATLKVACGARGEEGGGGVTRLQRTKEGRIKISAEVKLVEVQDGIHAIILPAEMC